MKKAKVEIVSIAPTCRACGETVTMLLKSRCVMRHQGLYVNGFSLYVPVNECPNCGERQ